MELGNMIFGHSRGEFEVPREVRWQGALARLIDYCNCENTGTPGFENGVFIIRPYFWGDCDCELGERHKAGCPAILPNFHYKPTDFQLRWYKYPLRDSYMNQDLNTRQFEEIIDKCLQSLKADPASEEK